MHPLKLGVSDRLIDDGNTAPLDRVVVTDRRERVEHEAVVGTEHAWLNQYGTLETERAEHLPVGRFTGIRRGVAAVCLIGIAVLRPEQVRVGVAGPRRQRLDRWSWRRVRTRDGGLAECCGITAHITA